ncbi:MAG: hypothetical protein R3B72_49645 [Polyangiaceae bacterium]
MAALGEEVALEVVVVGEDDAGLIEARDELAAEALGGGLAVALAVVAALEEGLVRAVADEDLLGAAEGVVGEPS